MKLAEINETFPHWTLIVNLLVSLLLVVIMIVTIQEANRGTAEQVGKIKDEINQMNTIENSRRHSKLLMTISELEQNLEIMKEYVSNKNRYLQRHDIMSDRLPIGNDMASLFLTTAYTQGYITEFTTDESLIKELVSLYQMLDTANTYIRMGTYRYSGHVVPKYDEKIIELYRKVIEISSDNDEQCERLIEILKTCHTRVNSITH